MLQPRLVVNRDLILRRLSSQPLVTPKAAARRHPH
jgi:hypothetical protein